MKKSIRALTAWLLFICIVLGAFAPMTASAAAKDWAGYDCVAYARARFAEYWGFELHWPNGNAQGYYYNAASFGDTVSSIPKVGALAVWGDSTYGHVAFVEQVSGNSVYISEGGYLGRYNERWKDLSSMDISWSGGYQTFLGFVYVKGTVTPPAPAQDPWIEVRAVSNITETDAKLNANVRNPGGVTITTVGFSLWDANGNIVKVHYAPMHESLRTKDNAYLCFWMLADAGLRLTKGTKYKYEIFIIRSDEKAFYSGGFFFYTAGSHTLYLHPEGGTCDITSKQVINGDAYGDLPVPQRPGYTFDGWYVGQNKITAGSIFRLSNGLDLYAHWNKVVIPGDLDGDGSVTIRDVMEACKVLARQSAGKQPTADEMARGNLDGDNAFTINDVMEICKILARGA